ncbi:uncharacterized protein LOC142786714 [Rhipicephalus microplus]|uniref:uncharacterized protein LOC142786714 n=1 Tax=Rhipicephalus microplus TaxID=6941 RepID=UPI003F6BFC10
MMWAQGSFGSIASTDQDKANCTASYDIAIPASYSPPHLEHLRSSRDVGDFAVAPNAHITVPTFPDNLALGQFQWQPLPRPMRLCRQQCCAEALAARNVLRRSLNAQRQRIRRLDEAYRTAERVRNAQRQRRLRANAEYRARELYRSRLRRMQKNALQCHGYQYGSIEELTWLRDCFNDVEWASLESLWPKPTRSVGWRRNGTGVQGNNATTWVEAVESDTRSLSVASTEHQYSSGWPRTPLIVGPPPSDDEPRTLLLLSVPNAVLRTPSTVTLKDLLSGALPFRVFPKRGRHVAGNE